MFRLPCYGTHNMTNIVANEREVKTKDGTIVYSDFLLANILDSHDNINDTPFVQQGSRRRAHCRHSGSDAQHQQP
jgi:hypothetical protein